MSKQIVPPQEVSDKLVEFLAKRYPELEAAEGVERSEVYATSAIPNVRYSARVTYYHGQTSRQSLLEFGEVVTTRGLREYEWSCSRDWLD